MRVIFLAATLIHQLFSSTAGSSNDHENPQSFASSSIRTIPHTTLPMSMMSHAGMQSTPQHAEYVSLSAEEIENHRRLRLARQQNEIADEELKAAEKRHKVAKFNADTAEEKTREFKAESEKLKAEYEEEGMKEIAQLVIEGKKKQAKARIDAATAANAMVVEDKRRQLEKQSCEALAFETFWRMNISAKQNDLDNKKKLAEKFEDVKEWSRLDITPYVTTFKPEEAESIRKTVLDILGGRNWENKKVVEHAVSRIGKAPVQTCPMTKWNFGEDQDDRGYISASRRFYDIRGTCDGPNGDCLLTIIGGELYCRVNKSHQISGSMLDAMAEARMHVSLYENYQEMYEISIKVKEDADKALEDLRKNQD